LAELSFASPRQTDRCLWAYGAGGRGVMTVAVLENSAMLAAMIDKIPKGRGL
jgi:hypothetical protein